MELTEALLKKVVLVSSILGIVTLYLYSGTITVDTVDSLEGVHEESEVRIVGEVLAVSQLEKVAFVTLGRETIEETEIVLFLDRELLLEAGDIVSIVGTTEEYEGEMQLVASSVVLVSE
jgi:DNA/RNA endonuclease YhcR with UshA esterase domain